MRIFCLLMNFSNKIFSIGSDKEFEAAALELFRHQAEQCRPYRDYLSLVGIDPAAVKCVEQIPMLPIELFKSHEVYCGTTPPEKVFTSSSTTGQIPSRHAMQSLAHYERAFTTAFEFFYGPASEWSIYGLLPNYLEREGSSLVYMVDRLLARCGSGGFFLDEYERLLREMEADPKPKILLGVSYALWDLAERYAPKLSRTVVMETGGMKGRREELPKAEFHRILTEAFGVEKIHSEYGMAELTSQAYSSGDGVFRTPAWMRVVTCDVNNPFRRLKAGSRGALAIIDLANCSSCGFILTQDMGQVEEDGSFVVEGRLSGAEIRGCNLLVQ